MNIADFEDTRPEFRPEEFFVGRLEGWALLQGPLGGVQRRATIKAEGTMISGVVHFDETWTFDDGKTDALQWQITPSSEGNYIGSEPTLDGEARGERAGCAYHWAYTRNVPGDDGSSTKLNFDDWFPDRSCGCHCCWYSRSPRFALRLCHGHLPQNRAYRLMLINRSLGRSAVRLSISFGSKVGFNLGVAVASAACVGRCALRGRYPAMSNAATYASWLC